jgi:hypothetical protein
MIEQDDFDFMSRFDVADSMIRELQSKLRKDLIEVVAKKTKVPGLPDKDEKDPLALRLYSLIAEYLMARGLWYSASVFVTEARFKVNPPEIEIVQTLGETTKRHSPRKLSDEAVSELLSNQLTILPSVKRDYFSDFKKSVLESLFRTLETELREEKHQKHFWPGRKQLHLAIKLQRIA